MKKLWQKMRSVGFVYIVGGLILSCAAALLLLGIELTVAQSVSEDRTIRLLILIPGCIASFVLLVLLEKHFVSRKFRKLGNFYAMASVIAFVGALLVMDLMNIVLERFAISSDYTNHTAKELLIAMAALSIILAAGISSFIVLFRLLTKNKAAYIGDICEGIGRISEQSESVTIEEKGGDELETISATINRMSQELAENRRRERELEAQRSELITNVSHDLRSPLTSIIGYVRLLKENGIKDEQKFNEYIEVTDRRLEGLRKLVDELFELTKLDAPDLTMNFEKGDATSIVKQFGFEMQAIFAQKGFALECDIDDKPFEMQLDYERLARVLQNLFANAAKYAEPNSTVTLSSNISGSEMHICLSNRIADGTQVDTASMFDRFYKQDRSRTDTSGAGLGLAIAKRITELHGGSISASQTGSTITVTVTLRRPC